MKTLLVGLALVGFVCGDVSHLGYKYPSPTPTSPEINLPPVAPSPQYIPPAENKIKNPLPAPPAHEHIAPTEAKIKTPIVIPASLPATEYIPPNELKINTPAPVPVPQPVPVIPQIRKTIQKGYNYIAPKPEQPIAPISEELTPQVDVEPAHELANDGYRYKTVRKIRYRYRA